MTATNVVSRPGAEGRGDPMDPATERIPPLDYLATVPAMLRRAADQHGGREFIIEPDRRFTYADVEIASRRVGRQLLAAGVGKASRVAMVFPQGAEWAVSLLAAARVGALVMPLSTFYAPVELRRALRHGDVEHLIVPPAMFGRDMESFVEAAVPELADHGGGPAFIDALPYLRRVSVLDGGERGWSARLASDRTDPSVPEVCDRLFDEVESEITPGDLFVTIFTSGTTSEPKGVVHTHGAQVRHGARMAMVRGLVPDDKSLAVMPFFWVGGLTCAFLPAIHSGSSLLCQEKFDAGAALELIEREKPTALMAWPNVRQRLLTHPSYGERELDGVPFLPPPGTPEPDPELFHNSLGMTETSGPHSAAAGEERTRLLPEHLRGSFGPRVAYVEHRIADPVTNRTLPDDQEGEICIRGYSVMAGMYKKEREEVFDAEGWYHTGDRGYFRHGVLFFEGRATEMIKTAGSNVAPREVELALAAYPGVRTALVFGVSDRERGEIVVAGVVPEDGFDLDVEGLLDHARAKLSVYKLPRHVVVLVDADVPVLASGKVDRRAARDALAERLRLLHHEADGPAGIGPLD